MPEYFVASVEAENKRLEQASSVVRAYMDGNLFLAPIDMTRRNLKVLDSATNNGFWLSQFQAYLKDPDSATLVGTDLQDRFPNPPRPGIHLQIQDINKPWPESWKSTFDYVHQALVLFQAGPRQRKAVHSLAELVKPGGWIELMEPQYDTTNEDNGPAFQHFLDMVGELWAMRGTTSDFAADLEGTIKDAGFVDVKSVLLPIGIGPKHKIPELADISVESTVGGGKNISIALRVVYGRKPEY
ncbi:uncharacterized protein F4812DRAFT_434316 [Daldinia caldariorum]|uniref:uncharacterized protein n=1 Tax=Daldinia caldariorum TaxID=326644 RepID=UPI0020073E4A|nr:uncharacterized protein F4812DRAFT_434316 [Daldinia caldariorum]KAI1466499.1 hypothetical protein F4812DRAFT_434316 [Daldinia caldariorum]